MPKSCPVCGSRKWRKDAISGNAACEEGHVFQDYRAENLVVENAGHALQKRTFKKGSKRNKRREEGRANTEFYHGEEAEWLKMQALQLILRLQVRELRAIWQLPEVYESIVRELWAYQLATAQSSAPPGYTGMPSDIDTAQKEKTDMGQGEDTADGKEDDKGDESSSDEDEGGVQTEKEEAALDPELLAELSDLSDQSDQEDREDARGAQSESGPKWKRRRRLRVSDTLVTLILGCWILRVPVMNVDLERLVNDNLVPYLDFARTTFIPIDMFKRMNREVRNALAPRKSPSPLYLFEETKSLARTLTRHFGLQIPEINLPPISWRVVSSLGANPTMYSQVHRLLAIIDINLTLIDSDVVTLTRKARRGRQGTDHDDLGAAGEVTYERTRRNQDVYLPEMSVAAAWVIVMKLAYGLDEQDRQAQDDSDPVTGMPGIETWISELEGRLVGGEFKGNKKEMEKQNFPSMPLDDIDRYLDQCEQVLLGDHILLTDAGPFPLLPRSDVPPPPPQPTWKEFHQSANPIQPTFPILSNPADPMLLPGEQYESYDAQDVTGTLPKRYEVVLKAAAQVVGVTPFDLGIVVELFERRMEKVRKERSRSQSRSRSRSRGHSRANSSTRRKRGLA